MQKRHRIFIAINLPMDIKKYLAGFQKKWPDLPASWVHSENLHITLCFLGDVTDLQIGEVCQIAKEVVSNYPSQNIELQKVAYGPDQKIPPRFLWVNTEAPKELSLLKNDLEHALLEKIHFIPEHRKFNPHITLARINTFGFRAIEPEERPEVNKNLDLVFTVESIEVMESELAKGGLRYMVIESIPLKS